MGAFYLLSLLTRAEPRGLPGHRIERVKLQRAAEGYPLDDVIIHAHDGQGNSVTLEIQVKRSITFAPSDQVFKGVVEQIAAVSRSGQSRHDLAIAIARTSHKIDGAYQDVLAWARQLGSAAEFFDRIERPGSANDDMRSFVRTFRSHLHSAGTADDNETVWRLLRRVQILVFDFTAPGSASEQLARERAALALHPDTADRAAVLWSTLIKLALEIAASGGDRDRESLIVDLTGLGFRLAGERRFASARLALAEASKAALADINDRVGPTMLTRHERIASVHAALDSGRYVEIRGDAGVGKSAILKHFAALAEAEGRMIVFSPRRTIPRGWVALRGVLGFDGTARDLLSDLASDGGAILFIDNLDLYTEEERSTILDLVREAPSVAGLAVIATARRSFGMDEPSWLPTEVLDRLGCAPPIEIDEISDAEVEELRHAAPNLAALLADGHPARAITRNLYRLSRLALQSSGEPVPHTETEMAQRWWETADGKMDTDHRERARLLRALAEQALLRAEPFDASTHPSAAVDALLASETISDFGNDRIAFRHDVLREWAIAGLLSADAQKFQRLPLAGPAPAVLARAVELSARSALERSTDAVAWAALLELTSREGVHGSWRRAVLLAPVRSEISGRLLTQVTPQLLANGGQLLRELIRTVIAVDTQPASKAFADAGIDVSQLPAGINVPTGPAWHALILWLLSLEEGEIPPAAIPDVVALYATWSIGFLGSDSLTPLLLAQLHHWLTEIEAAQDAGPGASRALFTGALGRNQLNALESELRTDFLLFCNRVPHLAAQYLLFRRRRRRRGDRTSSLILQFRGALAQAAPAELAELTATSLISNAASLPEQRHRERWQIREPFDYLDHEFIPASPTKGPFLDLLIHAPEHGLALIRRLVDHAIAFYTEGKTHDPNAVQIAETGGRRAFPWLGSYTWSREGVGHYSVTCGLMALEAWGHRRIESGEPVQQVIADVLGAPGAPAAYLLVAVDLIISHWPKSRAAAVRFLSSPELLCLDRARYGHDLIPQPDFFGLGALRQEPRGPVSGENLKQRPSRRVSLDELLGHYGAYGPPDLRDELVAELRRAAARLGSPSENADLSDPAFMAAHALNLCDPSNWPEVTIEQPDGTKTTGRQYASPEVEARHFAHLQNAAAARHQQTSMQAAINLAMDDPKRSSPEFAAQAVAWAQAAEIKEPDDDKDGQWMREQAVFAAAMIAMRDGDAELRSRESAWAYHVFSKALLMPEDAAHRFRAGVRFNPVAIAFVGMAYGLRDDPAPERVRALLEIAALDNPAAAHGFGVVAETLSTLDERLPRTILRSALAAVSRPSRDWEQPEDEFTQRQEAHRRQVQAAVDAEIAWLFGGGAEPAWPTFPPTRTRARRRGFVIGKTEQPAPAPTETRRLPDEHADHQAATLWLAQVVSLADVSNRPWLCELVRAYVDWSAAANGAGFDASEEVANPPSEWNHTYFNLLAFCLQGLRPEEVDQIALNPIVSLPDEPFFEITAQFLRGVDAIFFNRNALLPEVLVHIRSTLADRVMATSGWVRLVDSDSASVERQMGAAIAALFFNDHGYFQPARCYLFEAAIDRIYPFFPILGELIARGPSFFIALVALNLFEVAPRADHLPLIIRAAMTWLHSYPNNVEFWIDSGFGRRVCSLIDVIRQRDQTLFAPETASRADLDHLLASLVRIGVSEAARLERSLVESE